MIATLALLSAAFSLAPATTQRLVDAPPPARVSYRVWPSAPPSDCPVGRSEAIRAIAFTGRHAEYQNADTWYPSWGADGSLYSPWTDGRVDGQESVSFAEHARTGWARIVGDDPMSLRVADRGMVEASPAPYGGRYPCGSLVKDGLWFYGTYCLMNEGGSLEPVVDTKEGQVNWGILGPFVGFRVSTDFGKTWTETRHTPAHPLFPEPRKKGGPVRIGSPHFVDFGRNMEHSPDGKAYLVAHGAAIPDPKPRMANASWITGDCVYLLRVSPTADAVDDATQYEFFAGRDASGKPRWTHDFAKIRPLLDWNNRCGCVTMTYFAPLKRYLMCVTDGGTTLSAFNTYVLESPSVTGPWKFVTFMRHFGPQGYFVNIPSKFISSDGRTAWLCYAANFMNPGGMPHTAKPEGSRYGMCLQEIRLLAPGDPLTLGPLHGRDNIAPLAQVSVNSTYPGYSADGLTDGEVGGFPNDTRSEWASDGESDSATVRLTWDEPQKVDRVWLFDRPNKLDQITSGMLVFSDGTVIRTGGLPDDAKQGLEVRFPAKTVKWIAFLVTGCKPRSPNIGLSEFAVFRARRP